MTWGDEIASAMSGLTPKQPTLIKLIYTHGLLLGEAAAWVGMDRAEASRLLARALQQIGERIGFSQPG